MEDMMKKSAIIGIIAVVILLLLPSCSGNAGAQVIERRGAITLTGNTLTLLGPEIKAGQKAPDFSLVPPYEKIELYKTVTNVSLSQNQGKIRLISVVPSLDTPVCDLQTQRFEQEALKYPGVAFYTISMDSPFAQFRYCGSKNVTDLIVLSDYLDGSFGRSYGVLVKELRILSRALFIIDQNGTVQYAQYVKEISEPVDFDSALAALQKLTGPVPTQPTPAPTATTPSASPLTTPPATTQPTATSTVSTGFLVGNLAPDFQLNSLDGKTIKLSALRGKPVMLDFWATWCPYCRAERPLIQQVYNDWQSKGLEMWTIDIIGSTANETAANLASFMSSNSYSFPVLLDANNYQTTKAYNIKYTPTNFLIDKDGIIRKITIGPFANKAAFDTAIQSIMP
jgi:thioredoxin-dependent peroxiredoxin